MKMTLTLLATLGFLTSIGIFLFCHEGWADMGIHRKQLESDADLYGREYRTYQETPDIFVEILEGEDNVVANSIKPTQDGGFIVTGYTEINASGSYLFLAKFNSQGERLWSHVYGKNQSEGRDVVETHNGDFIVVGNAEYGNPEEDWVMIRFDSSGGFIWIETWGGDSQDRATGIIETSDHEIWIVGFSNSFTSWPFIHYELVIANISADGYYLSGVRIGQPLMSRDYYGLSLAEVFDTDGICVTGYITFNVGNDNEILLAKVGHDLDFKWAYQIGENNKDEIGRALVRTSDACLALAGDREWWDGIYMNYGGFLIKTNSNAIVDWARKSGGSYGYTSTMKSVTETYDSGLVITGGHEYQISDNHLSLTKWNFEGTQQWTRGFNDFALPIGYSVAEGADYSLLVAGKAGNGDALLTRCCSTGLNCLESFEGPSFSAWSPGQSRIFEPSVTPFTDNGPPGNMFMEKPYFPDIIQICSSTTYLVCPDGSGDFTTIQDAIDFAANGDIIELCDATFSGYNNFDLDFSGKCITVRSENGHSDYSILDCQNNGRGFSFDNGEGCHSIIDGVWITKGNSSGYGGGIYCDSSSPSIQNCRIDKCDAVSCGGGIWCDSSSPTIYNCFIWDNWVSEGQGAGISCNYESAPYISRCVIAENSVDGIYCYFCDDLAPFVNSCTIVENENCGVGYWFSLPTLKNCIVWDNWSGSIFGLEGDVEATFSDIEGGWPGEGNIDTIPLFVDPGNCDYHLSPESPCIDAGDPTSAVPLGGGKRIDMGAYEYWFGWNILGPIPLWYHQ